MDDEWFEPEGAGSAPDSIAEWLDSIAEAEGLSREETLAHLISSYWQLKEVFQLIQDDERFDPSADRGTGLSDSSSIDRSASGESSGGPLPFEEVYPGGDGESPDADDAVRETIESLEERVDTLDESVDELRDVAADDRAVDELHHAFQDLDDHTESIRAEVERVEESIEELNDRYERLLQTKVSVQEFSDFVARTESFQESIEGRYESLHDRIRTEFGYIRRVLEHLVERADASDERLDGELGRHREVVGQLLDERERLLELTTAASRRGISLADCAYCGHAVDLGLLETPSCPQCDRTFVGIEEESRLFGLSSDYRIETTGEAGGRDLKTLLDDGRD